MIDPTAVRGKVDAGNVEGSAAVVNDASGSWPL
jgi:hypothetical protein